MNQSFIQFKGISVSIIFKIWIYVCVNFITLNQNVKAQGNPPEVSIISPLNESYYSTSDTVILKSCATDVGGTVVRVEYYICSFKYAESIVAPYAVDISSLGEGTYCITAKVFDNSGRMAASFPVNIHISNGQNCDNIAAYVENGGYSPGSKVVSGGKIYECREWPNSGWCNLAAYAYGPGIGWTWQDAWVELGECVHSSFQKKSVAEQKTK